MAIYGGDGSLYGAFVLGGGIISALYFASRRKNTLSSSRQGKSRDALPPPSSSLRYGQLLSPFLQLKMAVYQLQFWNPLPSVHPFWSPFLKYSPTLQKVTPSYPS